MQKKNEVVFISIAAALFPLCALLSSRVATALAFGVAVLRLGFLAFVFPESHAGSEAEAAVTAGLVATQLNQAWRILTRHDFMVRLVFVLTISGVAAAGKQTIMPSYLIAQYGMTKEQLGWLLPTIVPSIFVAFTGMLWYCVPKYGEVRVLQWSS